MKNKLLIIFTLALLCIMTSCGVPSAEDQTTDHGDMADTKTVQPTQMPTQTPTQMPTLAPDVTVPTPDVTTPEGDVTVPNHNDVLEDVQDTADDLLDGIRDGIDDLTSPNPNANPENGAR